MNKAQAQAWVAEIANLLTGRDLITVAVAPFGDKVEVRQNQSFGKAYFVEHDDKTCDIALCDSYGVMTGSSDWRIIPDRRTIICGLKNGYGEQLYYTWTIANSDDDGKIWHEMMDAQKRLWKVH